MILKTKIKIFVLVFLATISATFLPFVGNLFTAKISDVNVYVPGDSATPRGGSAYIPVVVAPTITPLEEPVNPPIINDDNASQATENSIIQTPESSPKPTFSFLSLALADLSIKIPAFANILSNLNVKTSQDVANLQNYNIFLPGIKKMTGISGIDFSNFSEDQKSRIPGDLVFVLLGKGNIDALTSVDFSDNASALEKVNVLVKYPMRLLIKPSSLVKNISGYLLFESQSQTDNLSNIPQNFSVLKFNYNDNDNDGIYIADIFAPSVEGRYQIVTSVNYGAISKDIKTTTLVDPEGYIYEKVGDKELRINDAIVSLYKLDNEEQYKLWSADDYGQENPQITNKTGSYSFLVAEGTYYLSVTADGYNSYRSESFYVKEGKEIHSNIALEKHFNLYTFFNINTILIIILFFFVGYNFYRDWRIRTIKK